MTTQRSFITAILLLLFFATCKDPDPCEDLDCVNGTCANGVCDCDPGYELDANGKCTVISCDGIDCVNGTCVDGVCDCDPGYALDANGKCTVISCNGIDCVNGTCNARVCQCDPGYELDTTGKCTVISRDRFLGAYEVSEDCSSTLMFTYSCSITPLAAVAEVGITNFWGAFLTPVRATVQSDTLKIARQEPDADGFFVEGIGIYTKAASGVVSIQFSYVVANENVMPPQQDICTNTVYTKL